MVSKSTAAAHARHDVVVLGGGAAGCAAALLLAQEGHDVALVRPPLPAAAALAQSIPPSANKLLAELGMLAAMEGASFQPNRGNTVWWAGADPRVETFAEEEGGFHVDRSGLERVMCSVAEDGGVTLYDAAARSAEESGDGWDVRCRIERGPPLRLGAPWVLDATGRTGIIARREARIPDRATTTLALVRRWRRAGGFGGVEPTHTLVESYPDGWAWSVPLDSEVRCFAAMVDPRQTDLSSMDLDRSLEEELGKTGRLGLARRGAEPVGPAWACPASLYTASRFARPGLLLVGDAGSFIDPLSSFGVKKALASGWMAAVAVHTALSDGAMSETALRFFEEREETVYRSYRARSVDFFDACVKTYSHAYWTTRAASARTAAAGAPGADDPDALDGEGVPAVEARAALDRIRARPRLDAAPGGTLRAVDRPTVVGRRIVLATHLATDRVPNGLRYVRNVDLARLVEVAPGKHEVPDGWAAYNAGAPPVSLPDYLAALATAFAAGLLEHAGES